MGREHIVPHGLVILRTGAARIHERRHARAHAGEVRVDDAGTKAGPKHAVGALYDLVPAEGKQARPAGQWNEGRIVVAEGRLQHWLNGKKVVDVPCKGPEWDRMIANSKFKDWPFGKADEGRLALQDHGNEVAFRDLRIKRL